MEKIEEHVDHAQLTVQSGQRNMSAVRTFQPHPHSLPISTVAIQAARYSQYVLPVAGAVVGAVAGGVIGGPIGAFVGLKVALVTATTGMLRERDDTSQPACPLLQLAQQVQWEEP